MHQAGRHTPPFPALPADVEHLGALQFTPQHPGPSLGARFNRVWTLHFFLNKYLQIFLTVEGWANTAPNYQKAQNRGQPAHF